MMRSDTIFVRIEHTNIMPNTSFSPPYPPSKVKGNQSSPATIAATTFTHTETFLIGVATITGFGGTGGTGGMGSGFGRTGPGFSVSSPSSARENDPHPEKRS